MAHSNILLTNICVRTIFAEFILKKIFVIKFSVISLLHVYILYIHTHTLQVCAVILKQLIFSKILTDYATLHAKLHGHSNPSMAILAKRGIERMQDSRRNEQRRGTRKARTATIAWREYLSRASHNSLRKLLLSFAAGFVLSRDVPVYVCIRARLRAYRLRRRYDAPTLCMMDDANLGARIMAASEARSTSEYDGKLYYRAARHEFSGN